MRFNGSMTSGASWTVFRFLRQYHVTERDFPSGYIYGAQRYGYVETTLVWYTSVYIYVLGYISVVPHTTTTPSAVVRCLPEVRHDFWESRTSLPSKLTHVYPTDFNSDISIHYPWALHSNRHPFFSCDKISNFVILMVVQTSEMPTGIHVNLWGSCHFLRYIVVQ